MPMNIEVSVVTHEDGCRWNGGVEVSNPVVVGFILWANLALCVILYRPIWS